jgi:hypothetical protein
MAPIAGIGQMARRAGARPSRPPSWKHFGRAGQPAGPIGPARQPSRVLAVVRSRCEEASAPHTFFAQLGYAQADWQRLSADLRSQHLPLAAQEINAPPFGRKYRIRGPLTGPSGRTATLVSIWMVPTGEETAHLGTVYPEGS